MTDSRSPEAAPSAAQERSRWGRVKFGSRRLSALVVAAPIGLVLAVGIGAVAALTGAAGPRPLLGGIAMAAVTVWPCLGLVWALIVDRQTLRGATPNPEQSVESAWYDRAASGAFSDTLLITGLGTAGLAITGLDVPVLIPLIAVLLISMGSFGIRYLVLQRRG
ncbi:hypothetical protein [Microbacterium sp.]|uniref:hypothetical protein n=1 Tax=Microbacterium sp. TaxID=51671 RepID=UPI0039E41DA4